MERVEMADRAELVRMPPLNYLSTYCLKERHHQPAKLAFGPTNLKRERKARIH
jgi:hypothetical protein